MSQYIKFDNIKLNTTMLKVNDHFIFLPQGNDTVVIWEMPEQPTIESTPTIFYDAVRLSLPLINLWVKDYYVSEEKTLYELLKSRNTTLINYYESKDDKFRSCPDKVISIDEEDVLKIIKNHQMLIEHNRKQKELRASSNWKLTEWIFALNHYIHCCSSRSLEDSVVNIITALEALLVTGHDQVSYRVALNASLLHSDMPEVRTETFNLVKEMYGLRSKVVHADIQAFVKLMTKPDIYDKYFKLKEVLSTILLKTHGLPSKDLHEALAKTIFKSPAVLQ